MPTVIDRIQRWTVTLWEAGGKVDIAANPGENEIQLRFRPFPLEHENDERTDYSPGFAVLWALPLSAARSLLLNLEKTRVMLQDKENAYADYHIEGNVTVSIFYKEREILDFQRALDEAIRYASSDPLLFV
jgi:hypothetical protein